jgi:TPR repeat protein
VESFRIRTAALVLAVLGAVAPVRAAPPATDDKPVTFGDCDGTAWLAVRGRTPQQIAKALKLRNLRPATWKEGLAAAKADPEGHSRVVFLTSDVGGWTLVVSTGFYARVESRPPTFHTFSKELSKALDTEVQFFASVNSHYTCAWARAERGVTVRAFSCYRTRQRAVDEGSALGADGMDVAMARGEEVGAPDVAGIAGQWSIDPSKTHPKLDLPHQLPSVVPPGFLAELPAPVTERPAARPKLEPPDWAREAAANVTRPAAELDAACEHGDARACGEGALLLVADARAKRTLARAAELAEKACELRHAAGCALRGWMLRRGVGVDEDLTGARDQLEKACDLGHAPGCYLLGVALHRGDGTAPSLSGAWDAYERACAGGYAPACARTGDVGRRAAGSAGLAPRPECKGERVTSGYLDPTQFSILLERVRKHQRLEEGEAEVRMLARWQARLLRNAVFASRGRSFEARDLRAFFSGIGWYAPGRNDVDAVLGPEDRRNVALLQEQEACAQTTIAEDAGDDDGDWQLAAIYLAEGEIRLSAPAKQMIGIWELCHGPPNEGCPTIAFHPNGRAVYRAREGMPAELGSWRMEGRTARVRFFAELRLVGAGFSPTEPGDEDDEEPDRGVPKLFAIEPHETTYEVPPEMLDEDSYLESFGVKRSGDPSERVW